MKNILLICLFNFLSMTAMKRSPTSVDKVLLKNSDNVTIDTMDTNQLEAFIREKGGVSKLSCDELGKVMQRKVKLNPNFQEINNTLVINRELRRVKKAAVQQGLCLEQMSNWTAKQAHDYIVLFKHPSFMPPKEIEIMKIILNRPLSPNINNNGSTSDYKQDPNRWPHIDFRTMNSTQLEKYLNTYLLTSVEAELIAERVQQINFLKLVNEWDHEKAMNFVMSLEIKGSVNEQQLQVISKAIGLSVHQLTTIIGDREVSKKEERIKEHYQELKDLAQN